MILDKCVEVSICGNVAYYENLGYTIPKQYDSRRNRTSVKRGTKIFVKSTDVPKDSRTKVYVVCDNCKKEYLIYKFSYFLNTKAHNDIYFCDICLRKENRKNRLKTCDYNLSFGIFLENEVGKRNINKYWHSSNIISPYDLYAGTHDKYYFQCQNKEYHVYLCSLSNFSSKGARCSFCANHVVHPLDSLGVFYPKAILYYSDKNIKSIDTIHPYSNKKIYWKCENDIHEDYSAKVNYAVSKDFSCPYCLKNNNESALQKKVRKYLESIFDNVLHEWDCTINPINPKTGRILRYDNEIKKEKLIIEVMGGQHYNLTYFSYVNRNKELIEKEFNDLRWRDEFKKNHAEKIGYKYIEIPYWSDNKKQEWKNIINNYLSI